MKWYYAEGGEQRGPVGEADLLALAQAGKIGATTLVWNETMASSLHDHICDTRVIQK